MVSLIFCLTPIYVVASIIRARRQLFQYEYGWLNRSCCGIIGCMWKEAAAVAAAWVAVMSVVGAIVCALDKRAARRGARRVPEKTLWLLAVFGGAAGVWAAMLIAHHKTRKTHFAVLMPILAVLQLGLIVFFIVTA